LFYPSLCVKYSRRPEINQIRIEKQKHFFEKDYFFPQIIPWIYCGVHESHTIDEVHNVHNLMGKMIENIKACFSRDEENGKGWVWNLPKMHAFINMPQHMLKLE
jgi:hypothetical protein